MAIIACVLALTFGSAATGDPSYDFDAAGTARCAPQSLSTQVDSHGVTLVRAHGGREDRVSLRLSAVGRVGAMTVTPDGTVVTRSNRAEIRRGALTEWFVNDSAGVEHGCAVAVKPAEHMDGDLILAFTMDGDVRAELQGPDEVLFMSADERHAAVLRYGHLEVRDAAHRHMAAWFVVRDGAIEIHVDDHAARYPLDIDPLAQDPDWVYVDKSFFGENVAFAGDVNGDGYDDMLVGSPLYTAGPLVFEGRVDLFLGSSSGPATSPS